MCIKTHNISPFYRPQRFTLVELLVVVAIMGILMGMALIPFRNMLPGGGVDGAQRMLTSQLRMARQYAISNRENVAVLMPINISKDSYNYVAFRSCVVDDKNDFKAWIDGTEWDFLPTGAIIIELKQTPARHSPFEYTRSHAGNPLGEKVSNVEVDLDGDGTTDWSGSVRAVIFNVTGGLEHTSCSIGVCEAVFQGDLNIKNGNNWINVKINQFTGSLKVIKPED